MNALFAVEAERLRDATGTLETRRVLEPRIRPVHATKPVGTRGGDDGVHDSVPAMTGIDLVVRITLPDRRRWHPHRRGIVACAEDERLEPWRRFRDLSRVDITCRGFDLGFDPDSLRASRARFDLREQRVHEHDVTR